MDKDKLKIKQKMKNYITEIFKPFNFNLIRVEIASIFSIIVAGISAFSENYLGISGAFTGVLFVLLVSDFVTGIISAKKNNKQITSSKGLKTVYKTGVYILFMYVSYSLYKELDNKAQLLETIIQYFHIYILIHISFWELFSIDENLKKTGLDLGITNILKSTYQTIKSIISKNK